MRSARAVDLDVIVIGGGPAGVVAALRATRLGARTALVTRDALGGMAANDGPVPVRTLAHAARLMRETRQLRALRNQRRRAHARLSAAARPRARGDPRRFWRQSRSPRPKRTRSGCPSSARYRTTGRPGGPSRSSRSRRSGPPRPGEQHPAGPVTARPGRGRAPTASRSARIWVTYRPSGPLPSPELFPRIDAHGPHVGHLARDRNGRGADRHPEQRRQEQQAPAGCPRAIN